MTEKYNKYLNSYKASEIVHPTHHEESITL